MARREWKWTKKQLDKLNKVKDVLNELEAYKPLTLRQIYYQLVSKDFIENKVSQYGMLSKLLKWSRIDGHISWGDVEDRVRFFHNRAGFRDKDRFVEQELSSFLSGYNRNLLQSQDKYLEIWIEKDALSSIFTRVAQQYCVSVVVCRGFSSVSFLHDFKSRLTYQTDKKPVILYFGDFDPSGVEMLESMKLTLEDELRVTGIDFKRVALKLDDIHRYQLPHNPDALKDKDTRAAKHVAAYGAIAVELDALPPAVLEQKIRDAIENEIDIDKFNTEAETHNSEIQSLSELKNKIMVLSGL